MSPTSGDLQLFCSNEVSLKPRFAILKQQLHDFSQIGP